MLKKVKIVKLYLLKIIVLILKLKKSNAFKMSEYSDYIILVYSRLIVINYLLKW